jgi:hypothetical protein
VNPCPEDIAPILAPPSHVALWALAGIILAVIVIDGILLWTGHETMSQGIRHRTDGHPWWKVGAAVIIGVTLWHLLLGGPL